MRGELAISICGTWAMRVWLSLEPFIEKERYYRNRVYPRGTPPGFLVYYEDFICRIIDLGGEDAPRRIQQRSNLRRLDSSLNHAPTTSSRTTPKLFFLNATRFFKSGTH
jgi:hypothetical protein